MRKKILVASVAGLMAVVPIISPKVTGFQFSKEAFQDMPVTTRRLGDLPIGDVREYKVQPGDTFSGVINNMGIPYDETLAILSSSKEVFDFTKMNAGKVLKLVFIQEAFAAMEYPLSSDTVVHVKKQEDAFVVTEEEIPYLIENVTAKGTITDSLFLAAQSAGLEDKTTMGIADIFSSEIDFAADIREGDSFSIAYEKRSLDGKPASAGKVLAAKFINDGKTYNAFRYKEKFYNEKGESVDRQFLRSPLNYSYISSGFSYKRTNPVTKQITPHRAIDYAASEGTPVIATADGIVVTAGAKGALGITVELKHGNYVTQYAHLSNIAKDVKKGSDVIQGDVVGYVGSTGISTGPHLQYAMFENGEPINPLTTEFPRGESLTDQEKDSFNSLKNKIGAF